MPDEAPVTQTIFPSQLGLTIFLRMQAITAQSTRAPTMIQRIIDTQLLLLFLINSISNLSVCSLHTFFLSSNLSIPYFRMYLKQILQGIMQKSISNQSFTRNHSYFTTQNATGSSFFKEEIGAERNNVSNIGPQRASSPSNANSKTKIRLVSPFKDKGSNNSKLKENTPPIRTSIPTNNPSHFQRQSMQIQLGGKTASKTVQNNSASQLFHVSSNQVYERSPVKVVAPPTYVNFRRGPPMIVVQTLQRPIEPKKILSPNKICINNRSFDIGSIKSKIVYVVPMKNKYEPEQPLSQSRKKSGLEANVNPVCPSELVIQQENSLEDLKESYESQMKDIKQLQQQIEENNIQIKELLKSSNVSRHINTSRVSAKLEDLVHPEENLSLELIAERPVPEAKSSNKQLSSQLLNEKSTVSVKNAQVLPQQPRRDEVSVQTDGTQYLEDSSYHSKNESRHPKFSITKNNECQIQLICCKAQEQLNSIVNEQENQYTFAHDLEDKGERASQIKSQPSISHQILKESSCKRVNQVEFSSKKIEQVEVHEEIIPVSQRSIRSKAENRLNQMECNFDLKASRAETEKSIIKHSQLVINEQKQSEKIITPRIGKESFKSADNIPILSKQESLKINLSATMTQIEKRSQPIRQQSTKEKSIIVAPTSPRPTGQELKTSGLSGKRRINNNIYL